MNVLPALLLVITAAQPRVTVTDARHTRLSRIIHTTISEELRARNIDTGEGVGYLAEIVDVSDASGRGRTRWVQRDMTHAVQVTEILGGAAAEVRLYDNNRNHIATYKLTGSGSSSSAVGARKANPLPFLAAPLFRRTRSADAARAIGHDIAARIAADINWPASDTQQR
jgi:hypothetical protein